LPNLFLKKVEMVLEYIQMKKLEELTGLTNASDDSRLEKIQYAELQ